MSAPNLRAPLPKPTHDGRTVGYIAFYVYNARIFTERNVGVSPPDVSAPNLRAPLPKPTHDGRTVGYIAFYVYNARIFTERNVGVSPPDVSAPNLRAPYQNQPPTTPNPSSISRPVFTTRE